LVASFLFVVACAAGFGGIFSHAYPGDTWTYSHYARLWLDEGRFPYRDFYNEYPTGSYPVFLLPALIWDAHYVLVHKLLMTACGVGCVVCAAWVLRRLGLSYLRLTPLVLAPALMGPVFLNRYDPVPALLGSLALVMLLRTRERTAGALLGIGTAVKIYPAVVVPLVARRVRDRYGTAAAYLVAGGILFVPFFLLAPGGVGFSMWTQMSRTLQIESVGSSLLLVGSKLGIYHVDWIAGKPGSIDLGGTVPDVVASLSSLVAIALILLVARAYWRGPDTDARLVTAWAAAIAAFTVFGKVLSPQFMTWLAPVLPLAAGRKGAYAAGTILVAIALTWPEYHFGGNGLREQNWAVWLLLVRNAFLVATFTLLYLQLRERQEKAL
jgi:hypothetical protein